MPEPRSVLLLPMPPLWLLVDARRVRTIEDAPSAGGSTCDLADRLGIARPGGARRAIHTDRGAWLLAGERVAVRKVSDDDRRSLPDWLASLGERMPIAALIALDGGFALELDLDRLAPELLDPNGGAEASA